MFNKFAQSMNRWSPEIFKTAWNFATLAHHGQTYGGPSPEMQIDYINHIGSVAMEVIWALDTLPEYDADLAVQCAILHDVIEDTKYSYEDVEQQFGAAVADGVMALTKNDELPTKEAKMQDSLWRIQQQPPEIWLVKMADRIANLYHPPYYWTDEKKLAYKQEAILIYQTLKAGSDKLAQRLWQKIAAYDRFIGV